MNQISLDNVRDNLYKRKNKLDSSSNHELFFNNLKKYYFFIEQVPLLFSLINDLENKYSEMEIEADEIVESYVKKMYSIENESAAISNFVIKKCIKKGSNDRIWRIGKTYFPSTRIILDSVMDFNELFVEPLHNYIDEQLVDQNIILFTLLRYKQKCEWFQKENLKYIWELENRKGEHNLMKHLFEYLHDQGYDLFIEPSSASGEIDLIAIQLNIDEKLHVEVKVFKDKTRKEYIAEGFNQLNRYLEDYNERIGYLVIYNVSDRYVQYELDNKDMLVPYMEYNNKTVFILNIDISDKPTASKSGSLKPLIVSKDYLIQCIKEDNSE